MDETTLKNKKAWEYRAYEFWNMNYGTPREKAAEILQDPTARLRYHRKYFERVKGLRVVNPCGSNARIAVPLAVLGAQVTVFDISEENRRYALELAACAGVSIEYEVCDFYDLNLVRYADAFDIAYMEGGVLHYFHDLGRFCAILYTIIRPGGALILSDFHPFRKIIAPGQNDKNAQATGGDYFGSGVHDGDVAYKRFFSPEEQPAFPACSLRFYTLSDIFNALIDAGFTIKEFTEHPHWEDRKLPGEFTIFAQK